jgi:8-oxo-dGTP diphosphatase
MPDAAILARGPWDPARVSAVWRADPWEDPGPGTEAADVELERLRARGSPSYDGLAARLAGFHAENGALHLELQPVRWALRLVPGRAAESLSVQCVVRDAAGRWLAGRRASWLASWAGRWALGAAGAVETGENPVQTLARELEEEWSVRPAQLAVEALVRISTGLVLLVGSARLHPGAAVTPDHEHDAYAWWPARVAEWPAEAHEPLRRLASLLS